MLFIALHRSGLCFLSETRKDEKSDEKSGLPPYSFISLEAVHWSLDKITGLTDLNSACKLFDVSR